MKGLGFWVISMQHLLRVSGRGSWGAMLVPVAGVQWMVSRGASLIFGASQHPHRWKWCLLACSLTDAARRGCLGCLQCSSCSLFGGHAWSCWYMLNRSLL